MGVHLTPRRIRLAIAVLLVIGITVTASSLVLFSRSLSGIRGDFCSWAAVHYEAARSIPHPTGSAAGSGGIR